VKGPRPLLQVINGYVDRMLTAAERDPVVAAQSFRSPGSRTRPCARFDLLWCSASCSTSCGAVHPHERRLTKVVALPPDGSTMHRLPRADRVRLGSRRYRERGG
jgi:hypothetical protein